MVLERIRELFPCYREKKAAAAAAEQERRKRNYVVPDPVLSFRPVRPQAPLALPPPPPATTPSPVPLTNSDFLYIVLPYFNFCQYQSRTRLFLEFIERIRHEPRVRIVVVEARLAGAGYQLPAEMEGIYEYIGVQTVSECWLKESLINVGISRLPEGWLYAAWVDADLTFLNPNWVADTMAVLATRDVAQLFHTLVYLGPDAEALKIERSLAYMYLDSGVPYSKTDRYGHFMPGMAWALTRRAYKAMGGLIDWAILGSADRHMGYALMGRVEDSAPGNISDGYKAALRDFQSRCRRANLTLGYVKGTILHHWHGRLEDRRYKERWNILVKNGYDPEFDIYYNHAGLVQLTDRGQRMEPQLRDYFAGRREDHNSTAAPVKA